MYNVGSSLLILGILYLHLVHGLDTIVTVLLVLLGILTWVYVGFTDERKNLFQAQIRYWNARATYYEKKEA